MKKRFYIHTALIVISVLAGCTKVLDKRDLGSIQYEIVFGDSVLARTYVDYIYDQNLPAHGGTGGLNANLSEEVSGDTKFLNPGNLLTINDVSDFGTALSASNNYGKIRTINDFLSKIDGATFTQSWKNTLKGQVLFFRAWRYWELVKLYGGVPLVLQPLPAVGDSNKIFAALPRNKTSECIAQITKDLDDAAALLPGKWVNGNVDWGRITSGCCQALKARVLLYWASPQFNPGDLTSRWQACYDAAKLAKATLLANGYGLNSNYETMWYPSPNEVNNPEAVFMTGYNTATDDQYKKPNAYDASTRPAFSGGSGSNQPTKTMVDAYPMKDGKRITETGGAYAYNDTFFYRNRDPRFDKTIAYNGCNWTLNAIPFNRFWYYIEPAYSNLPKQITLGPLSNRVANTSGFFLRKAINPAISVANVPYSGTDWMEIRYAEVLLTLAEAANGVGKPDEAYTELKAIRARAGIDAGSGNMYGLKASMTRSEMFDAVLYERQIELAFEGKRYFDLRRWKLFETVINGKKRQGVDITFKLGVSPYTTPPLFAAQRDVLALDDEYKNYFTVTKKDLDNFVPTWRPEYYFFALPQSALDNNISLKQTNGWPNGAFDPLQ